MAQPPRPARTASMAATLSLIGCWRGCRPGCAGWWQKNPAALRPCARRCASPAWDRDRPAGDPPRGAPAAAQRRQRRAKGPVVEHGAIDQIDLLGIAAARQDAGQKAIAPRPAGSLLPIQRIHLAGPGRREGTGETGGGAGRQHQRRIIAQMALIAIAGATKTITSRCSGSITSGGLFSRRAWGCRDNR